MPSDAAWITLDRRRNASHQPDRLLGKEVSTDELYMQEGRRRNAEGTKEVLQP